MYKAGRKGKADCLCLCGSGIMPRLLTFNAKGASPFKSIRLKTIHMKNRR